MKTNVANCLTLGMFALLYGCAPATDVSAEAVVAVRAADIAWADTFAHKDLAGYMSFVESSASMQQPNGPTVTGTDAIRAFVEGFLSLPDLEGTWHPIDVEAARSDDLAYSTGTYDFSFTDPSGSRAAEQGKYLAVWRKQADGSWKMRVESFNSDLPFAEVVSE